MRLHCMRHVRIFIAGVIIILPVLYLAMLASAAWRSGLTWHEMDFNRDGTTSIDEFLDAADVGTRAVQVGGRSCTELVLLKDGLPVKVVCPAG